MTIELTLKIPQRPEHFFSMPLGIILISCDLKFVSDYRILAQLRDMSDWGDRQPEITTAPPLIPSHQLPRGLKFPIYDEDGETLVRGGPTFGDEDSTLLYASELRGLVYPPDTSPWNLAFKAFIEALPDDIPIILYWD